MTLSNLSDLQVVAGFPEADAIKVKLGQPATVTLSALTNTSVPGKVTAISPLSTVVSNVVTYNVTIDLNQVPSDVRTGMTASVAVVVDSVTNAVELPSSAVTTTGGLSTVQLIKSRTASRRPRP
jgi:multidrug efflux pump subunit AcrA (membrane-fusion protein)